MLQTAKGVVVTVESALLDCVWPLAVWETVNQRVLCTRFASQISHTYARSNDKSK